MTQFLLAMGYLLGPSLVALTGVALRLRWQARRDQRRQDTLRVLARQMAKTSAVEIHDVRDDGSHLRVRITPAPTSPDGQR
jgi:hypothetical protein